MIDRDQALQRLQHLLQPDQDLLAANLIHRDGDRYSVFGRFDIMPCDHGVEVNCRGDQQGVFSSLRVAVNWCVAMKYQQTQLAQEMVYLDQQLHRISGDLAFQRQRLSTLRDADQRDVVRAKLDAQHGRWRYLQSRMEKCISRAKYCQLRGFNDEIARTRRPAPHRPSRPSAGKPSGTRTRFPKSRSTSGPRHARSGPPASGRASRTKQLASQ